MTLTQEDLLSISNLLDVKIQAGLQAELQPVKDGIRDLGVYIHSELELIKNDIRNLYAELQVVKDDIRNLYAELEAVKDDIRNLYAELQAVKDDIRTLRDEVGGLNYRVTKLELHIENVTDKNIQLLAENYVPAAKRYEKATAQIEAMRADMEIIKIAIEHHSEAIHRLA